MDLNTFKNRLNNFSGENWTIVWCYSHYIKENDRLEIYVKDWSSDEETEHYIHSVLIKEDLEDEFNEVIKNLKKKGFDVSLSNDVLSFKQASEQWGIDNSTIRKLISRKAIEEGIDCKRIGSLWVVSKYAREKILKIVKPQLFNE